MKSKYSRGIYKRHSAPFLDTINQLRFHGKKYSSPRFFREYHRGGWSWKTVAFSVDIDFLDDDEMESVRQQILARTYAVAL